MPKSFFSIALALCLTACSQTSGTATMYLEETDIARCENAQTPANEPMEMGDFVYLHYPEEGLLCAKNGDDVLVQAYSPVVHSEATHRWVSESGPWIWGRKNTFEPHLPGDRTQTQSNRTQ